MCTVTIIRPPVAAEETACVRLVCNRDEQRSRPPALPPRIERFGSRQALLPIDPLGGGTWIAANDAGLAFMLMNAYAGSVLPPRGEKSRGLIIPQLLPCGTLGEALDAGMNIDARQFAPFRLIVVDEQQCVELAAHGDRMVLRTRESLAEPRFFTSSGLGDDVVQRPRREVFEQFLIAGRATPQQQDALHRHSWPDQLRLSICMNRPEARTVSITVVEIRSYEVIMEYEPLDDQADHTAFANLPSKTTFVLPRVAAARLPN
jgi:hypothetical protein